MSKYTTEVRFICETEAGLVDSKGYTDINTILSQSRAKIFDFDYPIWDNQYKSVLESKILKHYYTREIAFETVGLWKLKLQTKMQEIMPYYNKLYETTVLEFNPLYDVDLKTEHEGVGTNVGTDTTVTDGNITQTNNGTIGDNTDKTTTRTDNLTDTEELTGADTDVSRKEGGNTRKDLFSDTPQGGLTGVDSEEYLTTYEKIIDNEDSTNTTTTNYGRINTMGHSGTQSMAESGGNTRTLNTVLGTNTDSTATKTLNLANTDEYINHVVGKSAGSSYSKMIEDFRKTLLNVDMMIIRELSDLFFGLW